MTPGDHREKDGRSSGGEERSHEVEEDCMRARDYVNVESLLIYPPNVAMLRPNGLLY